jgi:hypothetical protein
MLLADPLNVMKGLLMGHGFSNQPHLRDNVEDGWVWT